MMHEEIHPLGDNVIGAAGGEHLEVSQRSPPASGLMPATGRKRISVITPFTIITSALLSRP